MRLRVTSIDNSVTKMALQDLFEEIGDIVSIRILRDVNPDGKNCMALIEMKRDKEGLKAIELLNDFEWNGLRMKVEPSQDIISVKNPATRKPVVEDDDEDDFEEEEEEEESTDSFDEDSEEESTDQDTDDSPIE